MKKLVTIILVAIMLLLFAGCGDYILLKKSDFDQLREHIEKDLPALDALMARKFKQGTMTPEEYMAYQSRRGPYNLWLADIARKIDSSGDLLGSIEGLVRMAGYGQYVDLLGGGGSSAVDPVIISRLDAMERIAQANNITMQQVSKDLLEMKKWIEDDNKKPEPKPEPEPEPEPKPQPEEPDPEPEPEKPVEPSITDEVFRLSEHKYKDEKPVTYKLPGLKTEFYIEFTVSDIAYHGTENIIKPFLTITNARMVKRMKANPHLNAGRIMFSIFGGSREAPYAGMFNLFWASDNNHDEKLKRGDKEEFDEWRSRTNVDWLSSHTIRMEFRLASEADRGAYLENLTREISNSFDVLTATLFIDGRKIKSRTAGYYCPEPLLVLPGYYFKSNLTQPVDMVLTDLVIDNLGR